jgi:hypothetical protein
MEIADHLRAQPGQYRRATSMQAVKNAVLRNSSANLVNDAMRKIQSKSKTPDHQKGR